MLDLCLIEALAHQSARLRRPCGVSVTPTAVLIFASHGRLTVGWDRENLASNYIDEHFGLET
jgi:hypothetical protein